MALQVEGGTSISARIGCTS
jgi:hypothetical protein